ncbi:MAG: porin [Methylophilus sp.]|nr:porin [Methylophilus sp.]
MRKSNLHLAIRLALFSSMAMLSGVATAGAIEDKIDSLQDQIDQLKAQAANAEKSSGGINGLSSNSMLGGYGELHYNHFSGDVPAGKTRAKDDVDFHRFVLFFGHRFNDWISFKSELEIEHSNTENGGAVELEQAYLDFNFSEKINAKAGLFLMPLGIINETHEPPTFYGVERNNVENRIIPSTWWEAGVSLYGELAPGWKYQTGLSSSLSAASFEKFATKGVREGRQNVAEAPAENIGFHARLDYSGMLGLTVGASVFTGNTGQNDDLLNGADARLTLWDAHARYQVDKFDLRALYAQGHLSDAAEINTAFTNVSNQVAEQFYGWYLEGGYKVWQSGDQSVIPFVRFEKWDLQDKLASNTVKSTESANEVWTVGVNYLPHPQVVLKADYQQFDKPDGNKGDARLNLGMGYMF